MMPSMTDLKNGAESEVDDLEVWKAILNLVKDQVRSQ